MAALVPHVPICQCQRPTKYRLFTLNAVNIRSIVSHPILMGCTTVRDELKGKGRNARFRHLHQIAWRIIHVE